MQSAILQSMQPEQQIIAEWLERTRLKKGWTWEQWAREAEIGAPTTLTRAIKANYSSVTSIPTLHALAQAAGVPSVLDFLGGGWANVEALKSSLAAVLKAAPRADMTDQLAERYVRAALRALELVGTDPAKQANQDVVDVAARAAVTQFLEESPQA